MKQFLTHTEYYKKISQFTEVEDYIQNVVKEQFENA